ncbi:MAG: DegT/DnrJ/EryC1/StrS family aminotransferase, partial [Verrucomicrobiae bacterium]|nr:DegT/DnrJ/EryC1/StrS family aminotransferase [Verrucomicrobiae bacterium]
TERTRAIIVTHIFGWTAPMDRICAVAKKHNLIVIEDTAQALLAKYKARYAGAWGDIGSFSFQASKQMGLGDGGMAITSDEALAKKLALHAGAPTFMSVAHDLHYNYRMPEQTAAIGLAQLRRLPGYVEAVRRVARLYDEAVAGCRWIKPQRAPDCEPSYYFWVGVFWGEKYGLALEDFKRVANEVGLKINVGWTGIPAYKHPLIAKRLGYGKGCPLDCPLYDGPHNRYPHDLCPVAEQVMPRLLPFKVFVHTPDEECEANAAKLRRIIEVLGK